MAILDPTQTAHQNWTEFYVITRRLITSLRRITEFHPGDHAHIIKDRRAYIRQQRGQEAEEAFDTAAGKLINFEC